MSLPYTCLHLSLYFRCGVIHVRNLTGNSSNPRSLAGVPARGRAWIGWSHFLVSKKNMQTCFERNILTRLNAPPPSIVQRVAPKRGANKYYIYILFYFLEIKTLNQRK
jgi:hypothetical protein